MIMRCHPLGKISRVRKEERNLELDGTMMIKSLYWKKIKLSSSGYKKKIKLKRDCKSAITEVSNMINKKAVIRNSYHRKYYVKKDVRITIDTDLKFYLPETNSFKLYPKSIVEIKYNTSNIQEILDEISVDTQLTKFSKYLQGVKAFERVWNLPIFYYNKLYKPFNLNYINVCAVF